MFKSLALSGALAAGLMLSPVAITSAGAAPIGKSPALGATSDNLILAGRGRGGGGFGGGGRSFGGGGRSFGGGGMGPRSFGGARNFGSRSFNRGSMGGIPRANFGGGKWRPGGGWSGGKHHHRHRHHRRFYGGGYYPYYGASSYYYGNYYGGYDCSWLRRKAVRTGSSYWWNRYEQCVSDY